MALSEHPLALITGGEGDLGQAIALQLRSCGFEVIAPGRSDLDVTDSSSVATFFENEVNDDLELLINNAGMRIDAPSLKISEKEWDDVITVNLKGTFLCSKLAFAVFLRKCRGHVINIGSFSALSGPVGQTNYSSAKAGVIGLTQSLAREGGRKSVRANCIFPGWMETKFTSNVREDVRNRVLKEHALSEFSTPQSAAAFIVFLHTEMPSVSGQVFQLDSRIGRWC